MKKLFTYITIVAALAVGISACKLDTSAAQSVKVTQSEKAKAAAESITFTENAEIENIKKRLELTSSPGFSGYVMLINQAGQPILYAGIDGKITSGGKRLTPPQQLSRGDRGNYNGDFVVEAPSDEGTFGKSSPYIYFWTVSGAYWQWKGDYLFSDQPFRLSVKPLVIDIASKQ